MSSLLVQGTWNWGVGHERVIVCVGSQLRRVVGDSEEVVDWHATLFLNIICHTTYSLTVAVCRYG